jgi:DNA polymerase I-like protein with 3'-5' exonuclease and polymerase domains
VHDEIIFEVPNDLVEEVTPVIVSSMEDRTRYPVPLTCDAAVLTERWQKA